VNKNENFWEVGLEAAIL